MDLFLIVRLASDQDRIMIESKVRLEFKRIDTSRSFAEALRRAGKNTVEAPKLTMGAVRSELKALNAELDNAQPFPYYALIQKQATENVKSAIAAMNTQVQTNVSLISLL